MHGSINYTKYTLGSAENSLYVAYSILCSSILLMSIYILLECWDFKVQNPFRNLAPDWVYLLADSQYFRSLQFT